MSDLTIVLGIAGLLVGWPLGTWLADRATKREKRQVGRAPADLPPKYRWARDELVRLRLENSDLRSENMRLQFERTHR